MIKDMDINHKTRLHGMLPTDSIRKLNVKSVAFEKQELLDSKNKLVEGGRCLKKTYFDGNYITSLKEDVKTQKTRQGLIMQYKFAESNNDENDIVEKAKNQFQIESFEAIKLHVVRLHFEGDRPVKIWETFVTPNQLNVSKRVKRTSTLYGRTLRALLIHFWGLSK